MYLINSISQDTQGVITPTKKTVTSATTSTAGLISAADKTKLDGIEAGAEVNPDIANNLTETTAGKVLDATQGKVLKDAIDSLDAENVGAIKDDYNYTYMGSPYTGNELILLHNTTTGENAVTDVASFLSSASGGSGTNQGALIHYTKTISVSAGSTAQTFPNSGTDDNITENMVILQAIISNPAAQGSDWTFTTANGTVTLNGTVNAATNVTLYFGVQMSVAPSIQVNLSSTSADNILKANPQPGIMGVLDIPHGGTGKTTKYGVVQTLFFENQELDAQFLPSIKSGWIGGNIPLPLDPRFGGTGATDAALHTENDYSSVLNVINAVKNTRIFPISIQKSGTALYSDMPTTNQTEEWNLLLVGNSTRITATLYLFGKGNGKHIYVRDFYKGSWFDSQWTQIY